VLTYRCFPRDDHDLEMQLRGCLAAMGDRAQAEALERELLRFYPNARVVARDSVAGFGGPEERVLYVFREGAVLGSVGPGAALSSAPFGRFWALVADSHVAIERGAALQARAVGLRADARRARAERAAGSPR
jgi:hypothetical protein